MTAGLHIFCMVVCAAILAHRAPALIRGPRDLVSVSFSLYVLLSALSYLVLLPSVYVAIDGFTGLPNSAGALSAYCVLGLTGAQQVVLAHWTYPPDRARRQALLRVLLILALILGHLVTFLIFAPAVQKFDDFYVLYTRQLFDAPYLVIYLAGCILGQVDVVRNCRRFARIAERGWLRRGMLVTTVGASMILVYCGIRFLDIVAGALHLDARGLEPAAWLCGDAGSALALIGWALPTAGPRLSAIGRWYRNYRAHVFLYPLWKTMCDAAPAVALDPPGSRLRDLFRVRDIEFWLYRRVIEIQDARRAALSDVDNELGSLTDRLRTGPEPPGEGDLAREVEWLTSVSRRLVAERRSERSGWPRGRRSPADGARRPA